MQIAVDISQVGYEGTGVARFTRGLIEAICLYDQSNYWTFLYCSMRQPLPEPVRNIITKRNFSLITYPIPPRALSFLWNNLHVVRAETLIGSQDWFISSDWTQPPSRAKKATIVHDLIFKVHPETVDGLIQSTQEKRLKHVARECSLIFADSMTTKTDLKQCYSIDDDVIIVNYPGIDPVVQPQSIKKTERPFILSVGKLEPRKNIKLLIEAFQATHREDIDLYIVGAKGWGAQLTNVPANVKLLGFVSDVELERLYASCMFFVFPSIYEGFGYPALEAMRMGAPTALANTSSLAEIGDGTSELFDPHSLTDITKALKTLMENQERRADLAAKGKRRVADFSWKRYLKTLTAELEKRI